MAAQVPGGGGGGGAVFASGAYSTFKRQLRETAEREQRRQREAEQERFDRVRRETARRKRAFAQREKKKRRLEELRREEALAARRREMQKTTREAAKAIRRTSRQPNERVPGRHLVDSLDASDDSNDGGGHERNEEAEEEEEEKRAVEESLRKHMTVSLDQEFIDGLRESLEASNPVKPARRRPPVVAKQPASVLDSLDLTPARDLRAEQRERRERRERERKHTRRTAMATRLKLEDVLRKHVSAVTPQRRAAAAMTPYDGLEGSIMNFFEAHNGGAGPRTDPLDLTESVVLRDLSAWEPRHAATARTPTREEVQLDAPVEKPRPAPLTLQTTTTTKKKEKKKAALGDCSVFGCGEAATAYGYCDDHAMTCLPSPMLRGRARAEAPVPFTDDDTDRMRRHQQQNAKNKKKKKKKKKKKSDRPAPLTALTDVREPPAPTQTESPKFGRVQTRNLRLREAQRQHGPATDVQGWHEPPGAQQRRQRRRRKTSAKRRQLKQQEKRREAPATGGVQHQPSRSVLALALSVEEQRVMESLARLEDRLEQLRGATRDDDDDDDDGDDDNQDRVARRKRGPRLVSAKHRAPELGRRRRKGGVGKTNRY